LPNQKHAHRLHGQLERPHDQGQRRSHGGIRADFRFDFIEQTALAGKRFLPTRVHLLEEHASSLGVPE
jgi:hypothetical protein